MNTHLATKNYSSIFFLERILWKEMWVVIKHITFFSLNEMKLAFCQALTNSENPERHKLPHSMAL